MNKDWTGGFRSVVGCLGASSHSSGEREENDFYATDPIAAEWLIKLENLDNNIWECACGQGHLGKVFEAHGFNVKATDLIDRGYGEGGYSNARGGRGGNRGGGRNAYARGGYSYADENEEKIEMLREMMNEAGSEEERRTINNIIRRMEKE